MHVLTEQLNYPKYRIKMFKVFALQLPENVKQNLLEIQRVSVPLQWTFLGLNPQNYELRMYKKDIDCRLIVFLSNLTVNSKLYHPKHKKYTTLIRKNCTIGDVQNLLLNPRTHLSKKEFVTNYSSKHRKNKVFPVNIS